MRGQDDKLRIVQSLLAKAESSEFPAEAETLRNQAEALMFQWRLEEAAVSSKTPSEGILPVWSELSSGRAWSEFRSIYYQLFYTCCRHAKVRVGDSRVEVRDGAQIMLWEVLGYEMDVRYAEILFTSFQLAFAAKMEPQVSHTKPEQQMCYELRMAGWDGGRVASALWGVNDKGGRAKARRMFEAECRARGEDPSILKGNVTESFRLSYADAFVSEARSRLYRMAMSSQGGELVLKSREDKIQQMWEERHPPVEALPESEPCAKCQRAKSGHCMDHPKGRSMRYRTVPRSDAGTQRGRIAAQSVDLGGRSHSLGA